MNKEIIDENGNDVPPINCANCLYSNSIPVIEPDGTPVIGQEQLVCMWGPPQVTVIQIPTPAGMQSGMRTQFPPVGPSMCCHQHEADPELYDLITGNLMEANEPN